MTATPITPIPQFKRYQQEATFWDTHSFAEYWETLKPAALVYDPKLEQGITVRFDRELKQTTR